MPDNWQDNPPAVTVDWYRNHRGCWVAWVSVATRDEVTVEVVSHGARMTVSEEARRD